MSLITSGKASSMKPPKVLKQSKQSWKNTIIFKTIDFIKPKVQTKDYLMLPNINDLLYPQKQINPRKLSCDNVVGEYESIKLNLKLPLELKMVSRIKTYQEMSKSLKKRRNGSQMNLKSDMEMRPNLQMLSRNSLNNQLGVDSQFLKTPSKNILEIAEDIKSSIHKSYDQNTNVWKSRNPSTCLPSISPSMWDQSSVERRGNRRNGLL